jgi:hypothetical protein
VWWWGRGGGQARCTEPWEVFFKLMTVVRFGVVLMRKNTKIWFDALREHSVYFFMMILLPEVSFIAIINRRPDSGRMPSRRLIYIVTHRLCRDYTYFLISNAGLLLAGNTIAYGVNNKLFKMPENHLRVSYSASEESSYKSSFKIF